MPARDLRAALARVAPEGWALAGVILLYLVPLVTTRYFPGLDLPWHVAGIAVLHRHDDAAVARDFLGYVEVDVAFSSYLSLYFLVDALAFVTRDVVIATQLLIAIYVVLFVLSARRLLLAFGTSGALAVLAAPAAYSTMLEFGFVAFAIAYPIIFYLWAVVRELLVRDDVRPRRHAGWALMLSLLLGLTHPFAAAMGLFGAVVLATSAADRARLSRLGLAIAALALGAVPLVAAAISLSGTSAWMPPIIRRASLWQKITNQAFSPVSDSLAALPAWALGFQHTFLRPAILCALLGAAAWTAWRAGRSPRHGARWWQRYAPELLFGFVLAGYLLTPFKVYWPRPWYAAQPRWAPVLVVLALACSRARPDLDRSLRALALPLVVSTAAAVMLLASFATFAKECADFRQVARASASRARTIGLIENSGSVDRHAPGPWRHFTAYLMAEKGGYASNLPISYTGPAAVGSLVPVRVKPPSERPALPPANPIVDLHGFDWHAHGRHWDQFLIRDADPRAPHDYFGEHAAKVELVARAGRWRLYRRKPYRGRVRAREGSGS